MSALAWRLGRILQSIGLIVILVGVLMSVDAGMGDESLKSQRIELMGLMVGGGMFLAGWVLTKSVSGGE